MYLEEDFDTRCKDAADNVKLTVHNNKKCTRNKRSACNNESSLINSSAQVSNNVAKMLDIEDEIPEIKYEEFDDLLNSIGL